jgi:phage gp37-like protein
MGDVATLKSALISKITAATGVVPVAWAGEEKALSSVAPAIFVQWAGGVSGPNQEIGAVSYAKETVFLVLVLTADGTTDGDVQAATYLDQIRAALNGVEIGSIGVANPYPEYGGGKTEALIDVHAGVYLYGQAWAIEQVEA